MYNEIESDVKAREMFLVIGLFLIDYVIALE